MNKVIFKEIDYEVALKLIEFSSYKKIGETIYINGSSYTLDFISRNSCEFFKSRGISIYFLTKRSVVRISDHWARTNHHPKSNKLNCGLISGKTWVLNDKSPKTISINKFSCGKYPFVVKAGIAGLSKINLDCEHWRN